MFAIYKREVKSYFRSFIGLLFIAVTLFFVGLYFTAINLLQGYPYFSYAVSSVIILFLISVPVLTMRILAEEKRSRTDQLILTAPVSVGGVVLGKFLALLTIFAIPTGLISIYPLILNGFGAIPLAEAYLAVLAFFLYGMMSIAVGVLLSSVTESQVISAVLTFLVLFLAYMMDSICGLISSTGNLITRILGCLDMYTPFPNLMNGTLDVKSVFYFVSMTALALFLTVQSIQKRRYSFSRRTFSMGAYSTGLIAAAVGIILIANLVLGELPASWVSVDVTSQKLYSLTEQTREYVKTIDQDVTIYVIVSEENRDTILAQTLQRYDDLSEHIRVEYVDPNVNPRFYTQYTSENTSLNSLILVSDKRNAVIDYNDIYETDYDYDYYTGGYSSNTTGYDGEGQITSALDKVLTDDVPRMYMTQGHGEASLSATFTNALKKENTEYESINLMDYEEIPEDAACLLINAPTGDFSPDDTEKVTGYLERGGNVILVTGIAEGETPNLDALCGYMGLEMAEGLVVEQDQSNYYRNPYYLLPNMSYSSYTAGLSGQCYVFAPFAQGILIQDESREDIAYTQFLTTSDSAFAKADLSNLENYEKGESDREGPFALGVSAVKTLEDGGEATLVMYGCEQIFSDEANVMVSGANQVMFTNTISAFAKHEVSISIPAKSYAVSYLMVPQSRVVLLGVLLTVVLPLGCLAAGFVIWFRRRKL